MAFIAVMGYIVYKVIKFSSRATAKAAHCILGSSKKLKMT